ETLSQRRLKGADAALVMDVLPPVARHAPLGAGRALVGGVMLRRRQGRPVVHLVGVVVEVPVLVRLEAADERVAGFLRVRSGVLGGGSVAAADVPALRAAAQ